MTDYRIRKAQGERLAAARKLAGFRSARDAALSNGWPESTVRAHEGGTRTIGQDDAERYARRYRLAGVCVTAKDILFDTGEIAPKSDQTPVPIMGYIGAGFTIEPDYEQVPPEGLDTVDLPFVVPDEIIAFVVKGESMRPVFRDGDTVLVWRDQRLSTDNYIGEEAAVRTTDDRRYLKEIQRGQGRAIYNLHSYNAPLIEGVRLAWVGEIYLTVKASQLRRLERQARTTATRRARVREETTAGMDELPLPTPPKRRVIRKAIAAE